MSLILEIKVTPQAGRYRWVLDKGGKLKCYLLSPPERNKANEELLAGLAKALKLTKQQVHLVAGATSRTKIVRIDVSLTFDEVIAKLGIEKQGTLF